MLPFLFDKHAYRQEEGAHLVLLEVQVQVVMTLLAVSIVGVKETVMSPAATINPVTEIAPLVAPTDRAVARLVATKPLPQEPKLVAPLTDTASVTQVRAALAANTTSDALARLV